MILLYPWKLLSYRGMRGDIPSLTDEPQNNLEQQVFKEEFENILSIAVDIAIAETE